MNIEYVLCVIQINVDVYVMKKSTNEVRGDNKKPSPLFGYPIPSRSMENKTSSNTRLDMRYSVPRVCRERMLADNHEYLKKAYSPFPSHFIWVGGIALINLSAKYNTLTFNLYDCPTKFYSLLETYQAMLWCSSESIKTQDTI